MATTLLFLDQKSDRIVYFATEFQARPRSVTLFTDAGILDYLLGDLPHVEYQGDLPANLLPQTSWLFKCRDGAIELSPPRQA